MTEHDLMEAGDSAQTSGLSSPPRRDSMEDADSTGTLTRKRPRLDSGSRATRKMSEDVSASDLPPQGNPAPEPVEVTINVRSHPPSSQPDTSAGLPADSTEPAIDTSSLDSPPVIVEHGSAAGEADMEPGSPPVVEINLDTDTDDGYLEPQIIEDDLTAEDVLERFPFAARLGGLATALPAIGDHVQTQDPIDRTLFPQLTLWLNEYPSQPSQWLEFYVAQYKFWDDLSDVFRKILQRRYLLGEEFAAPGETEAQVVFECILAYVRTCIRLIQIDVAMLEALSGEAPADHHFLCFRHLKSLSATLRCDTNTLFRMLQKEYNQETQTMASHYVMEFFRDDLCGITQLARLAELSWAKAPVPLKNWVATQLLPFLELITRIVSETPEMLTHVDRLKVCETVLPAFRTYDTDLQVPGKILDVQFNRDMVINCASLIKNLSVLDLRTAKELADEFMGFDGDSTSSTSSSPLGEDMTSTTSSTSPSDGYDLDLLPALASNAWKFKLLKKYISKGRMELRVFCISTMDQQLVEIWKEYNLLGAEHPLMQYLADYLLHGKVVDYIIGVDSHPQLISRSGNIVGFLVVTRRYTDKETDAIWRTIANSPDPRVVSAIIAMLKHIVGLMQPYDLSAMIAKLYQLPIESYTVEVLRFARELTIPVIRKTREWDGADAHPTPAQLFVRMMQDTAPSRTSTKLTTSLFQEASDQLSGVASSVGIQERLKIYRSCVDNIANKSPKATGSAHAIFLLCKDSVFDDPVGLLVNQFDVARHLILELCDFVETGHSQESTSEAAALATAFQYRIQLIAYIGIISAKSVPSELYDQLWDHIFGKDAWSNDMRDQAWWSITETAKRKPRNEFCSRIISDLIPNLDSIYYTKGLFDFIQRLIHPLEKRTNISENSTNEVLEIPGANLLWPLVLNAPTEQVVDLSAKQLAHRYLDIYRAVGVTFEEVEEAHVALAEECAKRLISSYRIVRSGSTVGSASQGEPMAVVASEDELRTHERHFTRTLLFAKMFLLMIRSKPEFSHSRRVDSKCESVEQDLIRGDPLQVRFQAFNGATNDRQSIIAGKEDTLQELYDRLCRLTGFTKLKLIVGGKALVMEDSGDKQLKDIHGIDWVLVSKAMGGEPLKQETDINANCSIFEATILNHFEEMYSCMDSEDHISEAMFDFLFLLKPPEAIAEAVAAGDGDGTNIFPPGKVFQAQYAGLALQTRLRAQLNKGIVDENFLSNTIQLLDSALLNTELISPSLAGKHDVPLASVLVRVLLGFLKERPLQDVSSNYFSNEERLIERLFSIIYKTLETGNENIEPVYDCYATVLEAFLHSRKVWEAFVCRPDFESLHKILLLVDGRSKLREMITQSIASICGGDLPSSSPLTASEIASFYWKTISSIIPHSVEYPTQSAELFDIAEQVFRRNDEYDRDERGLRAFLSSWSILLLNYKHEEFVGRDDIDTVVLGFTKLLLCCIQSLKSFKKPLDAGPLLEQTFLKFLFPPAVDLSDEEHPNERIILPVMNSETRKELYELMLALAEDSTSYETLLELTHSLLDEEETQSAKNYGIDRSNEIRSSTGYVGLVNPRAICYMNSLLTQLFMNVNFRQFMLNVSISDDRGSQRLLSDTQRLFAQMQNTFRKSADPRDFAACVKGLNSEPIDINVQMDADEFYNLLFDQWEGQMLSPATKQLFRSFYGGHTVNQIKSKECEHVSERVESFFVIQCDVQGKANLQESLQSFVEGDVMEGDNKYKCESCGGKFVDAVKRTCLKDVPDNLIFHLKRFDFDLIDMRRTKINDHFEFPSEIDVSPYNVDHLSDPEKPPQEDLFELVGVLVHQGNSENGHYYSFIRERPSGSGSSQKWLEFNDRDVSDFEPSQIAYQAYGGLFEDHFQRQQKPFSAYMLFYQRKSAMDADHQKFITTPLSGGPKVSVPAELEMEIAQDNEAFVREYCLYDPNHSRFIRQILSTLRHVNNGICSDAHEQENLALGIAIQHINQVISRLRDISNFDEIMIQLKKTVQGCAMCRKVAIHQICSNEHSLVGLLLRCPHMRIRAQIRTFLLECLLHLRAADSTLYGIDTSDEESESSLVAEEDGALAVVTQQLGLLTQHMATGARGWDDLFRLLCQIVTTGSHEAAAVLGNKLLVACCHIFCMQNYAHLRAANAALWRLVEKRKGVYNQMIELVFLLLGWIDLNAEPVNDHQERLSAFNRATLKFPLTREERSFLFTWHEEHKAYAMFDTMIEKFDPSKSDRFLPGDIIKQALAIEDPNIRSRLFLTIHDGITTIQSPGNDPYIRAAISFCEACENPNEVARIVRCVAQSTAKISGQGGEACLDFFTHLPNIRNEEVAFFNKSPEFFYEQAIIQSPSWAPALLAYEEDVIRRNASALVEHLFFRVTTNDRQLKLTKHKYMRAFLQELCRRIISEYENGTARIYVQPMFVMARVLAGTIAEWSHADEESLSDPGDLALLNHYNLVDQRWRSWPLEDEAGFSADNYDDSQYEASDSDEPIDVER